MIAAALHRRRAELLNPPTSPVWLQRSLPLAARSCGIHVVTDEIVAALPELASVDSGLAHFFLQHRTASLATAGATPAQTLIIPVGDGRLLLGRYQDLYLWEHAGHRPRGLVVTAWGQRQWAAQWSTMDATG